MDANINHINVISKALKLVSLAVFCAFFILLSNYYYSLQSDADKIISGLSITVFLDKNHKDKDVIWEAVESSGLVLTKEFVSAQDAYLKTIEKHPFLKDVSVPGDKESFQAYLKVLPKGFPAQDNLLSIKNGLLKIEGIDEVVIDFTSYGEYVKIKNVIDFYFNACLIFAIIIFVFFVFKSVLFVAENESNARKLAVGFSAYLLASAAGFVILWTVCVFVQYPLSVKEGAVFYIIPFTAVCGIIFKD
ncbi:MAG: hypothetical protein FWD54_04590 [Endomicrobia bacterium]|nr:hypothetical protein [Endomicrobiia bacterium]MCL2799531.1 hypothetical protein [Endomicrobiia bacterium]